MKINWKVRVKSPQFWIGILGVIASPVLAYYGLSYADMTTWVSIGDVLQQFFSNPFLICTVVMAVLSFIGVLADPTTKGVSDSAQALGYEKPKDDAFIETVPEYITNAASTNATREEIISKSNLPEYDDLNDMKK